MNIAITGANGFLGKAVIEELSASNYEVFAIVREHNCKFPKNVEVIECGKIGSDTDWSNKLKGIDAIVHSAARAHVMHDKELSPIEAYREVNTKGTLNLAKHAAVEGVSRFIFISSVKVNGEATSNERAFRYDDPYAPEDDYGVSKMEAENALISLSKDVGMEIVVIRPPLVYGVGVKANFASMMNVAKKNLPLPLGAIRNKRSLVGIDNLVDLIITCINHPKAANETFLVSDDHDVSTTELLEELTRAAGKKPWLIPVSMKLIQFFASLLGKNAIADRLCGNLQVDISHTKNTLGWKPPVSFEDGISRCFSKDR